MKKILPPPRKPGRPKVDYKTKVVSFRVKESLAKEFKKAGKEWLRNSAQTSTQNWH